MWLVMRKVGDNPHYDPVACFDSYPAAAKFKGEMILKFSDSFGITWVARCG